jgi:CHASE3 domain sensor protein
VRASASADRDIDRLRSLLGAASDAAQRVDSLAPLVVTHLADLDRIAELRARTSVDSVAAAMRDEDILQTHDRLDAMLSELRDDQRLLFAARSRDQAARASDAGILLAIGLLVSFIAAVLALSNIRRYLTQRRKLELQRAAVLERSRPHAMLPRKRTARRRISSA